MNKLSILFLFACCFQLCAANAAVFQVDTANSTAYFEVGYFGHGLVKGALSRINGKVELDDVTKDGTGDITFDMTTVETGSGVTNGFIKSKSIFHTEMYPTMTFHATRFDFLADQLMSVNGDLQLHGVTKPIRLETKRFSCGETQSIVNLQQNCTGEFSTVIYRSNFGMGRFSLVINDEVSINVSLVLERLAP